MDLKELRNCCLRNINSMSDKDLFHVSSIKDLLHIRQTDACFQKAEVDFMLTYFCVKVEKIVQITLNCKYVQNVSSCTILIHVIGICFPNIFFSIVLLNCIYYVYD